jgi:hypothetical protein
MGIQLTETLALVVGDGVSQFTKTVLGLTITGALNQQYIQNQLVGVSAPVAAPTLTAGVGGSMATGVYHVKVTYVDAPQGESLPSPEATSTTVAASGTLTVTSPPHQFGATAYNVYITAAAGATNTETLQNASPILIGNSYTQSAAVTAGAALPGTNTTMVYAIPLPQIPVTGFYLRNLAGPGIARPATPTLSQQVGGSLPAQAYYVQTTLVNAAGETLPSVETGVSVSANNVLVVAAPVIPTGLTGVLGYNVYAGNTSGSELLQNSAPLPLPSTSWIEPATGIVVGTASPPTSNTTAAVLTISWTPQGGSSNKVIDLQPQAAITFVETTSVGGFSVAPGTGGITDLKLAVSMAGTSCELIVVG